MILIKKQLFKFISSYRTVSNIDKQKGTAIIKMN